MAQRVLGATPLLSVAGNTLLIDKNAILERWTEHFNSVLNRTSTINDNAINRLPQIECNGLLDEFPTVTETRKLIHHLSSGKASSAETIHADIYKAEGLQMIEKLTELFHCTWSRKRGYFTRIQGCLHIPSVQTERNREVCSNHRGISLVNCWKDTSKNPFKSHERSS